MIALNADYQMYMIAIQEGATLPMIYIQHSKDETVHYKYNLKNKSANDIVLVNIAAGYKNSFEADYTVLIGYDEQSSSNALYMIRVDVSTGEIESSFILRTEKESYITTDDMHLSLAPSKAFISRNNFNSNDILFFASSYSSFAGEDSRHVLFRQYTTPSVT